MAVKLKDRNRQIPNGMVYYDPISKWKSQPWQSFEVIVQGLAAHRQANAKMYAAANIGTDYESCANDVDTYNAQLCQRNKWFDYITGAPNAPKSPAPTQQGALKRIAAVASEVKGLMKGYKAIKEWRASEHPAVPAEISESRAAICVACPNNQRGDLTSWFTVPFSEMIRKEMEEATGVGLATPHDERLGVCAACFCPLKLKVHSPIQFIKDGLDADTLANLKRAPSCWIVNELAEA